MGKFGLKFYYLSEREKPVAMPHQSHDLGWLILPPSSFPFVGPGRCTSEFRLKYENDAALWMGGLLNFSSLVKSSFGKGKFSFFAKISGPNDTTTGAERKALLFFTTLFKLTSQAPESLELDVRVIESMSRGAHRCTMVWFGVTLRFGSSRFVVCDGRDGAGLGN